MDEGILSHDTVHARILAFLTPRLQNWRRQGKGRALRFYFSILDVVDEYFREREWMPPSWYSLNTPSQREQDQAAPFFEVAWDLATRGIFRPMSIWPNSNHMTFRGTDFEVTPFGEAWLDHVPEYSTPPTQYETFGRLLAHFESRYGAAYKSRSVEALSCYQAHTFLACCTMCGAAAESVLLAIAVAKGADEAAVIAKYLSKGGRRRTEDAVIGRQLKPLQEEFRAFTGLLKYWRDTASHGAHTHIGAAEAYLALVLLLQFAVFGNEHWAELTSLEK